MDEHDREDDIAHHIRDRINRLSRRTGDAYDIDAAMERVHDTLPGLSRSEKRTVLHGLRQDRLSRRDFLKLLGLGAGAGITASLGLGPHLKRAFGTPAVTGRASDPCNGNGDDTGRSTVPAGSSSDIGPTPGTGDISGSTLTGEHQTGSFTTIHEPEFLIQNTAFTTTANGINCSVTDPDGVAYIDHCYFDGSNVQQSGDGGHQRGQGIWVDPGQPNSAGHQGTLVIRNCYFTNWGDNPIYAEAAPPHGEGGNVIVENCYFRNNNRGCVRVSGGSEVYGCHFENPGSLPNPDWASVALFTWYEGRGEVIAEDCHIDMPDDLAVRVMPRDPAPQWTLRNCEIRGSVDDRGDNVTFENRGESPQVGVPEGVPTSPDEAMNG